MKYFHRFPIENKIVKLSFPSSSSAVQNERQPRNTATIRPETFREMEQGHALREAAVAVGVFSFDNLFNSPPPVSLLSNSGRYGPSAALNGCLPVVSQLFQSNHTNQASFNHHSAHHHHHHPGMHFGGAHFAQNALGGSANGHNPMGMNLKASATDPNNNMDTGKQDLNRSSPQTSHGSSPRHEPKEISGENNEHGGEMQRSSPSEWEDENP